MILTCIFKWSVLIHNKLPCIYANKQSLLCKRRCLRIDMLKHIDCFYWKLFLIDKLSYVSKHSASILILTSLHQIQNKQLQEDILISVYLKLSSEHLNKIHVKNNVVQQIFGKPWEKTKKKTWFTELMRIKTNEGIT